MRFEMHDIAKYPIPLYLNQKFVFDLLAMMEGGLSQIETVRSTASRDAQTEREVTGDVGIRNVFAFLGVSLSGGSAKSQRVGDTSEVLTERVHTPNSLFARLRDQLWEEGIVKRPKDLEAITSGTFAEFSVSLQKNPLIDALEGMRSFLETALIFSGEQVTSGSGSRGKGKRQGGGGAQNQNDPNAAILKQLTMLLSQLQGTGSVDIIGQFLEAPESRAVLTLDPAFLSDPSMSDLLDAEYTVFGKVTKVIKEGSPASLNLLRKTSLGKVQGQLLQKLKDSFSGMEAAGFAIPDLVTDVRGPAIQVLPVAIFS